MLRIGVGCALLVSTLITVSFDDAMRPPLSALPTYYRFLFVIY